MIQTASMTFRAIAVAAAFAGLAGSAAAQEDAPAPHGATRRLALIAGANDGGPNRARLRYAMADAERFARVLQQVGGVSGEDAIVLLDPSEASLRASLRELGARAMRARGSARTEVVFYYSGHSDEEGLLVRGARVPYTEVRRWLDGLDADVRIAVLDSCSSGALTRRKGGVAAAPFLLDASARLTGQAILTSSSADEASQESDRIGASYFTHYLVTGLRGAADASQDGKVTLTEAYQFAFEETLARTERSRSGAQHPEWDIQLAGAGDLVLTDLRGTGATLVLPTAAAGRFFVRDSGERLVAELRKTAGRPLELALDPGGYRVTRETGGKLDEARVAITPGGRTELPGVGFTSVTREATARRGGEVDDLAEVSVDLSIFPPLSRNGDRPVVNHVQLGLVASRTTRLRGFGLAPVLWADEDVTGAYVASVGSSARGRVAGLQLGVLANVAGSLRGVQFGDGLNLVRGDAVAWQTGFANWVDGATTGLQNGVVNYARGGITGAQLGLTSVAAAVHGTQIGLVNVGGDVHGAQIGLVNVGGEVHGAQIGLVNVASAISGAPLGILSFVGDGEQKLLVLGDENGILSGGVLLGSRSFHSILSTGVQRRGDGDARFWPGFGLGTHLARGTLMADVDVLFQRALVDQDHGLATLRVLAGWQLGRRVAFVAGPTFNVFWAEDFRPGLGGGLGPTLERGDGDLRAWIGLSAGLRLGVR